MAKKLFFSPLILGLLLSLLWSSAASAGFIELGLSGSYRRSNLDEFNFTETKSLTGSFSYFFLAQSAIEISYTKGLSTVQTDPSSVAGQTTKTEFELIGADLILSYGKRESSFRPFLKFGAIHISRKIVITNNFATDTIRPEDGIAPSAGLGVKLVIEKQLAIKLGIDAWTTPLGQDPVEYNYTGRAGVSWIF